MFKLRSQLHNFLKTVLEYRVMHAVPYRLFFLILIMKFCNPNNKIIKRQIIK